MKIIEKWPRHPDDPREVACDTCKWRTGKTICKAFDKIPKSILDGSNDHRSRYPTDGGIRYEKK